jgi:hypothetical protein
MAARANWLNRIANRFSRNDRGADRLSPIEVDWGYSAWREHNPVRPAIGREQEPLDAAALRTRMVHALGEQLRSENVDYRDFSHPDYEIPEAEIPEQVDTTPLLATAYGLYTGALVTATDWDGREVTVGVVEFEPNLFGGPVVVLPNADGTVFHVGFEEVQHAPTAAALSAQLDPAALDEYIQLRRSVERLATVGSGTPESWQARRVAGAIYTRITGVSTDAWRRPESQQGGDTALPADADQEAGHQRAELGQEAQLSGAASEALDAADTGVRSSSAPSSNGEVMRAKAWGATHLPARDDGLDLP